jgi:hypothetical protein
MGMVAVGVAPIIQSLKAAPQDIADASRALDRYLARL